jgi:hypothetical protein
LALGHPPGDDKEARGWRKRFSIGEIEVLLIPITIHFSLLGTSEEGDQAHLHEKNYG